MAKQQDITDAKETYSGFLSFLKWGTAASVLVTVIVVLIIAS